LSGIISLDLTFVWVGTGIILVSGQLKLSSTHIARDSRFSASPSYPDQMIAEMQKMIGLA
jgi:hypothetical protein